MPKISSASSPLLSFFFTSFANSLNESEYFSSFFNASLTFSIMNLIYPLSSLTSSQALATTFGSVHSSILSSIFSPSTANFTSSTFARIFLLFDSVIKYSTFMSSISIKPSCFANLRNASPVSFIQPSSILAERIYEK